MMDVGLDGGAIDAHLAPLLDIHLGGPLDQHPIDALKGFRLDPHDVVLQCAGAGGALAKAQAHEAATGNGVGQVKRKPLIGQPQELSQQGGFEHGNGLHVRRAGVSPPALAQPWHKSCDICSVMTEWASRIAAMTAISSAKGLSAQELDKQG